MFHTAAYTELTVGAVVNENIEALVDSWLTIRSGQFFIPRDVKILYGSAYGDDLTTARLNNPKMRLITPTYLAPLGDAVIPGTEPRVANLARQGHRVDGGQDLQAEVTDPSVGGTQITVVVGLETDHRPTPSGRIYTRHGTSVTAAAANVWTQIAVTWDTSLPPGNYEVVGLFVVSANAIAARLILPGQIERPGSIGAGAADENQSQIFRMGALGSWGMFPNTVEPLVEVLANAADAAHTVYLDLVKVG